MKRCQCLVSPVRKAAVVAHSVPAGVWLLSSWRVLFLAPRGLADRRHRRLSSHYDRSTHQLRFSRCFDALGSSTLRLRDR